MRVCGAQAAQHPSNDDADDVPTHLRHTPTTPRRSIRAHSRCLLLARTCGTRKPVSRVQSADDAAVAHTHTRTQHRRDRDVQARRRQRRRCALTLLVERPECKAAACCVMYACERAYVHTHTHRSHRRISQAHLSGLFA